MGYVLDYLFPLPLYIVLVIVYYLELENSEDSHGWDRVVNGWSLRIFDRRLIDEPQDLPRHQYDLVLDFDAAVEVLLRDKELI